MTSQKNVSGLFLLSNFCLNFIQHSMHRLIFRKIQATNKILAIDKIMDFTTVFVSKFRMMMMSDDDKHIIDEYL